MCTDGVNVYRTRNHGFKTHRSTYILRWPLHHLSFSKTDRRGANELSQIKNLPNLPFFKKSQLLII